MLTKQRPGKATQLRLAFRTPDHRWRWEEATAERLDGHLIGIRGVTYSMGRHGATASVLRLVDRIAADGMLTTDVQRLAWLEGRLIEMTTIATDVEVVDGES